MMPSLVFRRACWALFSLWLVAGPTGVMAAVSTNPLAQDTVADSRGSAELSPVLVDGTTLFSLRGVTSLPSDQRAKQTTNRIRQIAANEQFDPQQLRLAQDQYYSAIYAGDMLVLAVVDADARVEGVERPVLARVYLDRIRRSIQEYRHERSRDYLLRSGLHGLLATVALLFALFILRWLARRIDGLIDCAAQKYTRKLENKTFSLGRIQQLWTLLASTATLIYLVLAFIALVAYVGYTLGLFPWTRHFSNLLLNTLQVPLSGMVDGIIGSIPNLIFILLLVVALKYLLGIVRLFFSGIALGSISWRKFEPEWAMPTYRIVRIFIIAFGLVMAYPYIPGSGSEAFKGLTLLFGLLISLGSSSIISHIIAGYSLLYRRAFRIGDWILIGNHLGEVREVGALVTHLRTMKNESVVVPNSEILNSSIVNYSTMKKQGGVILHTAVGIGYETPWRQVEAMLKMAADKTPCLLSEPQPFVLQKTLGDFCVVYELNAYTDTPEIMPRIYSNLHENIQDVFNEYGVQIMTPAYERDPPEPKIVPRANWYAAPAHKSEPE